MIMDKEVQLATTVALDLGSIAPGPGKPIKMFGIGLTADLVITHGATSAAADALTTVAVPSTDLIEFELPSTTLQFIKATFLAGSVSVVMAGNQTAK